MNRRLRMWSCLAVAALVLGLAGCNTIQGIGQDMSAAGQAIEREADKNKGY